MKAPSKTPLFTPKSSHRRKLHAELRRTQVGDGELLMPHAMRAERIAEETGRNLNEVLADFPAATKSLDPCQKFVGPDGREVYLPKRPR